MTDKYKLCSQALVLIGARPIASFEGLGAEEVAASTLYDPTVETIVAMRRWRCMSRQEVLSRDSDEPTARWSASYAIPSAAEVIHAVTVNDQTIPFDRYEDRIFCDADELDTVVLDYTYRAGEPYWPAYFTNLVRLKLASQFAIAVAEDPDKASVFEGRFVREFGSAKQMEGQGRTAPKLPVGSLRRYHRGRA